VVERLFIERERERVSLQQGRLDPRSLEVNAGEIKLLSLDIDAEESNTREFLSEDRQDRADSAADLEQACSGLELGAVADQPVSPVLCLLDEPVLLARAVAVNVLGYGIRLGSGAHPASRRQGSVGDLGAEPGYSVGRGSDHSRIVVEVDLALRLEPELLFG
jgi:hypothetical protein